MLLSILEIDGKVCSEYKVIYLDNFRKKRRFRVFLFFFKLRKDYCFIFVGCDLRYILYDVVV